jgi:DNA-binding beta-propeller fold protein YncE
MDSPPVRPSVGVLAGLGAAFLPAGCAHVPAVRVGALARPSPARSSRGVYADDGAGMLSPAVRGDRALVYVPNSESGTVDVIDQRTDRIVGHFDVGVLPQHVTPAYGLRRLYVLDDASNSLTPIDPKTGLPGKAIPVADPYNLYFTPNGRYAIVVAERLNQLDFRDPRTMRLHRALQMPCHGVNHLDFAADGSYLLASCEFSGELVKVDLRRERVEARLQLPGAPRVPQDVKVSPDGHLFYVADAAANGVWRVAGDRLRVVGFVPTGAGAHGLIPSRDARLLYVTNRGEGSISVLRFRIGRAVAKWRLPGGGSPDMGGVSADGRTLWVSGRYNGEVYAVDTRSGRLRARIRVGAGPHGLCVWPQPGRRSLGHTGAMR